MQIQAHLMSIVEHIEQEIVSTGEPQGAQQEGSWILNKVREVVEIQH